LLAPLSGTGSSKKVRDKTKQIDDSMKKVVFLTLILSVISVLLFGGIAQAKFLPGVSDIFSRLENAVNNVIIQPLSNQLLQLIQPEPKSNFLTAPVPPSPTPSPIAPAVPSSQPAPTFPNISQYIRIEPTPSNPKPPTPQAVTQPVVSSPPSYATLTDLTNLQTQLTSLITANQTQDSNNLNQMVYAFAPTQKIDNLGTVTISNATVANDLTLGGSLLMSGNLTVSGTQSFSGNANFSGNVGIGMTPNNLLSVYQLIDFNNTDYNTKLGYQAGKNIVSGAQYNTFVGYQAGYSSSTASTNAAVFNTAIGTTALYSNTTGYYNSAMGHAALYSNTTGYSNSAMGYASLYSNTTGNSNSAMGRKALASNTTGYYNSAMGYQALYANTTGYSNSAMGYNSLSSNTTGNSNSAMGVYALLSNTTGYNNSAMGYQALRLNTTGYNNTANGYNSLYSVKPQSKAITGFADYSSVVAGTVLATSTAHGLSAGTTAGVGIYGTTNYNGTYTVTYIDDNSFYFTDAWAANDATGWWGIDAQGKNNTALGFYSGYTVATGTANVFLGYYAGAYELGSNAFYVNNVNESNTTNDKAYSLLYGTFSGTAGSLTGQQLVINGKVGIGTSTPNQLLTVVGTRPSIKLSDYSAGQNLKTWLFSSMGGNLYIGTSTDAYATSTPAALTILNNGNVGISTTSPSQQFSISGLAYIGGAGTSTIENNLYVMGTLRATRSYVGDLIFGNNFLLTESEPAASPQSLVLKNQRGEDILSVDENGNLEIKGELKTTQSATGLLAGQIGSPTILQPLSWFLDQLQQIGITITNEYIKVKEFVAEKIFTDEITVKKIRMVDKATGEIYCTWIENGEWQKAKGDCPTESPAAASTPTPTLTSEATPTPEMSATPEATPSPETTSVSD